MKIMNTSVLACLEVMIVGGAIYYNSAPLAIFGIVFAVGVIVFKKLPIAGIWPLSVITRKDS